MLTLVPNKLVLLSTGGGQKGVTVSSGRELSSEGVPKAICAGTVGDIHGHRPKYSFSPVSNQLKLIFEKQT